MKELYLDEVPGARSFASLQEIVGRNYPLLSYLFFLKDRHRFLPVTYWPERPGQESD